MRGRMSAVFGLVVTGGPRLGDIESGSVAGAAGVRFSVVSGGLLCLLGVGAIMLAFPQLARYDSADWIEPPSDGRPPPDRRPPPGPESIDDVTAAPAYPHVTLD
jgi:hypothetical protein